MKTLLGTARFDRTALGVACALLLTVPAAAADPGGSGSGAPPAVKNFYAVTCDVYDLDDNGNAVKVDGSVKGYGPSKSKAIGMAKKRLADEDTGQPKAIAPSCATDGPMTWYNAMNEAGLL